MSSYFERALKVAPGGVHSPVRSFKGLEQEPIFFESAQGAWLKSVDGQEYLDFCMSFGPLLLGHRDPDVQEAVLGVIDKVWTLGTCERYSLELSEWIVQKLPHVDWTRYVSSGTEAVMSALRLARGVTGREKILKFEGCYHGHVDSMLVKAGSGLAGATASDSAGVAPSVSAQTLIAPLDDLSLVESIFEQHSENIAAVIIEPLPANFGLLPQRESFLRGLRALCDRHNSLLIFDEVISGFRVATGGMAEKLAIEPDLVTYGKIIGGGFPVGCYGGKADYKDWLAPVGPVYQAGTLSANPVGMVAGLATLKKVEELGVRKVLSERMAELASEANAILSSYCLELVSEDSLFWIRAKSEDNQAVRTVQQISPLQSEFFSKLFPQVLKEGVYLSPNAYELGFLSWAHGSREREFFLEALSRVRL